MRSAPGRNAYRRHAIVVAAVLLSGCVSTAYRDTVGRFGTLTKAAVAAQDARLDALAADETERVHADLAARRVDLRWDGDCAALLSGTAPPTAQAPPCRLIEKRSAPGDGVRAVETVSYDHIRALGAALADYSENLIALAADATADRKAFAASVAGLATSLGGLDGALREATGARATASDKTLDGIGAVVGKAGGLLLAAERARALRRIVARADPLVQEATGLLADVDGRLGVYDMAGRAQALVAARNAVSAAVNDPAADTARIRAAQDALFAKFARYHAGAAEQQHYAAIGAAHAKLAAAARDDASPAEVQAAIEAVIDLAGATSALIERPHALGPPPVRGARR